ncbi:hypothetical protein D7Y16_16760 [Stenotrophomonas maltophilia]|nr:hypothetical protein [Stenotrophomonas maltophilia]MBA0248711.1 hypothetical protein [Stenotrophomonas maltophilia]MBA0308464.1 hypothetical protein [Stenotrophomonas maltophilia]MBA0440885.1 hypothetical protein [Stenotrophomonas maltophilia]MBA0517239.1 hypothetical protein [Stenotrophomonas maltophilia]
MANFNTSVRSELGMPSSLSMSDLRLFNLVLKFSGSKDLADELLADHMAHVEAGFAEGIFVVGGPIVSGEGGWLLAHCIDIKELERFVARDPFVENSVVTPEIIEIAPMFMDGRIQPILGRKGSGYIAGAPRKSS